MVTPVMNISTYPSEVHNMQWNNKFAIRLKGQGVKEFKFDVIFAAKAIALWAIFEIEGR